MRIGYTCCPFILAFFDEISKCSVAMPQIHAQLHKLTNDYSFNGHFAVEFMDTYSHLSSISMFPLYRLDFFFLILHSKPIWLERWDASRASWIFLQWETIIRVPLSSPWSTQLLWFQSLFFNGQMIIQIVEWARSNCLPHLFIFIPPPWCRQSAAAAALQGLFHDLGFLKAWQEHAESSAWGPAAWLGISMAEGQRLMATWAATAPLVGINRNSGCSAVI